MDPVSLKCCVDGKGKADCTQTVQLAGHRAGALEGPSQGLLPVASRTLRRPGQWLLIRSGSQVKNQC